MKKYMISLILAMSMLLSMAACGAQPKAQETVSAEAALQTEAVIRPAAEEVRVFTDDAGRQVAVPAEITRIVPSGPLAQIILLAIAPDMFVGLATEFYDSAEGIIPEAYFNLPYFGQLYGSADLNIEELAMADPQLIIDIGEAKPSVAEELDALQEQTTIPSAFISTSLETMPQTYRALGKLLGREEKGEQLARFCERVYDRTLSIMEEVGDNKVNALYVLGQAGLNVLAKDSYHAELIDLLTNNLAVVENPMSKGTGNAVSMEQIALWNPDFVIFGPGSIYGSVDTLDAWQDITAIANDSYVEVPDVPHNWMSSPPAVQRYLGLIWLTAQLYPEYCDYDVRTEILEYYALFYGCTLTDQQYETIIANAFLGE